MKKLPLALTFATSVALFTSSAMAAEGIQINVQDPLTSSTVDSVNTDDASPSNSEDTNTTKCENCKKCKCECEKDSKHR